MISYNPLWKVMKQRKITTYQLIQQGIDKRTIQNLRENKNITLLTAEKICNILKCGISEIVEFKKDDSEDSNVF